MTARDARERAAEDRWTVDEDGHLHRRRHCVTCGRVYLAARGASHALYCGHPCQQRAYRAKLALEGNYNRATGRPLRHVA